MEKYGLLYFNLFGSVVGVVHNEDELYEVMEQISKINPAVLDYYLKEGNIVQWLIRRGNYMLAGMLKGVTDWRTALSIIKGYLNLKGVGEIREITKKEDRDNGESTAQERKRTSGSVPKDMLINDYIYSKLEKINQSIIEAKWNYKIKNVIVDYYLELEKEIWLIFVYNENILENLYPVRDLLLSFKRGKLVKLVFLLDRYDEFDLEKAIQLCDHEIKIQNKENLFSALETVKLCKNIEVYQYSSYVIDASEYDEV